MRNLIFLLGSLFFSQALFAGQVLPLQQLNTQPASLSITSKSTFSTAYSIPALSDETLSKLTKEDSEATLSKAYRFALAYEAKDSYTDDGVWSENNGTAIWKLELDAQDTHSLNFGFTNVNLPKGASLFIYTKDQKEAVVFDHTDNKPHKQLWTPVFESENVVLEINVPISSRDDLSFDLTSINQGYRSFKNTTSKSGSCNIDVVCPEGDAWRDEIRSVARYINRGVGSCTGTLVNNTNQDGTPYFLTAAHCVINPSTAPSLTFYWNFETSLCSGAPNGTQNANYQFQTGSTFLAADSGLEIGDTGSDFALVLLDSTPDARANVYYSGWQNSANAPSSGVGIHHPAGDEKRISFDDEPLTITNYTSNISASNGKYLRVAAWNAGTTEGGSSGSGIWNSHKRLVGTLSGGFAACINNGPTENNQPDWYGRFFSHWEGAGSSITSVKNWLAIDNAANPVTFLNGINNTDVQPPVFNFQNLNVNVPFNQPFSENITLDNSAVDPILYTLSGPDGFDFTLSNNTLNMVSRSPGENADNRYEVIVTATDANNDSRSKLFVVQVGFELGDIRKSIPENVAYSTVIPVSGSFTGDVVLGNLSGSDASLFNFSGGNLTMAAQNFESPVDSNRDNVYEVTITAIDSDGNGATISRDYKVFVSDVNESGGGASGLLGLFICLFSIIKFIYTRRPASISKESK